MSERQKLTAVVGGFVFAILLVGIMNGILMPFIIGLATAYFLDPVCDRLVDAGLPRTPAAFIVVFLFTLIIICAVAMLVPMVAEETNRLFNQIPGWVETLRGHVSGVKALLRSNVDSFVLERIQNQIGTLQETVSGWTADILSRVVSGGLAVFDILTTALIAPIVGFYMLRDWDTIVQQANDLLPPSYAHAIRTQMREVDRTMSGFIRGIGVVCVSLATYYATFLTLAGLKFGLVIGLLSGVVAFVPIFGALLGLVASTGLALVQFDSYLMVTLIAAIYLSGQFIETYFLQPLLVGQRVRLHPVWVIFALLAGGAAFGAVGILLAVPIAAIIGVGVRFALHLYKARVLGTLDDPLNAPSVATNESSTRA